MAEGEPYRYRASMWWPVVPVASGLLGALAVAAVASGNWWAVPWAVAALGWCLLTLRYAFVVTVDVAARTVELRAVLGRRRRALADLRGAERASGTVLLTFSSGTASVFSGPGAEDLVAYLHRVHPALRDPALRALRIVLRGYDRAEVDEHRRRLHDLRDSADLPADLAAPDFSIVLRGYARAEVDAAITEMMSAAHSGS